MNIKLSKNLGLVVSHPACLALYNSPLSIQCNNINGADVHCVTTRNQLSHVRNRLMLPR